MCRGGIAFSVIFLVLATGGCATIFTGTSDDIHISTDPEDAKIYREGRLVGEGDVTLTIQRAGTPPEIRVEKTGYESQSFKPETTFNNVAMINSTFVLSWGTDILSGSVVRYAEDSYHVQLIREGQAGLNPAQRIVRFSLLNAVMIKFDLAVGKGEYLTELAGVSGSEAVEDAFHAELLAERSTLLETGDPKAFAMRVDRIFSRVAPMEGQFERRL